MIVHFDCGVRGVVNAISKNRCYRFTPSDYDGRLVELLSSLALNQIPSGWPSVTTDPEVLLPARYLGLPISRLPNTMVVADLVGYCTQDRSAPPQYRRFAWLESSLVDDITDENKALLRAVPWPNLSNSG